MSGDGASGTASDHPLIGHDSDLAAIRSFVDRAHWEATAWHGHA